MALIRWLGHAAFYIELEGYRMLIDPWITNPLSPYRSIETFSKDYREIDYIFVTHSHGDHVGEAVDLLKRYSSAKIVAVYELAEHIAREANAVERSVPVNIGGSVKLEGIEAVFTPAFHSSSIGSPSGVIIFGKELAVYHMGDTGLFSELVYIKELYNPTAVLIPIGGHFTMGVREAVKAVEILKPRYAIPMHYNTFNVIRADPVEFKKRVEERVPETKVVILRPGESLTL